MSREAIQQEPVCAHGVEKTKCDFCHPKQEPVAWISEGGDVSRSKRYMDEMGFKCNPLYTAPPKREWVGLTEEEVSDVIDNLSEGGGWIDFLRALEAKLKEKNT